MALFQGYGRLRESSIRGTLMGNSRQFFLLSQQDETELAALAADLGLSAAAVEAIRRYPLPGGQHNAGSFTYFVREQPPVCGTAINAPSPELLYLAGTGGAHFEQRRKDFGGEYHDFVTRLSHFAQRKS